MVGRRSGTLELYDTREFNSGSESGITKPVASNKLGSDPIMDIEVQSSAGRAICAYSKQVREPNNVEGFAKVTVFHFTH